MYLMVIRTNPLLKSFILVSTTRFHAVRRDDRCVSRQLRALRFGFLATCLLFVSCALSGCMEDVVLRSDQASLVASPNSVNLGSVSIGQSANALVNLVNRDSVAIQVGQLSVSGQAFSVNMPQDLPISIGPGGSYSVHVGFVPATAGPVTGQLTIVTNSSSSSPTIISLSGEGVATLPAPPHLSSLTCNSSSVMGSGAVTCAVTLSAQAPSGGLNLNLSSNNPAVTVPATVTVSAETSGTQFTAKVAPVLTSQPATLSATADGTSLNVALQLEAYIPSLTLSTTSLSFTNVPLNSVANRSVNLISSGTAPVTITAAAVTGARFAFSGPAFPITLNPGVSATMDVEYNPVSTGAASGQITIASTSSSSGSSRISLSGTAVSDPGGEGPPGSFTYGGSQLLTTLIPPNPHTPISSDFFGLTIEHTFTPFPSFPVSTLRFWDVDPWLTVEPSSGQFDWAGMDATIAMGQDNGVTDFIYTFGNVPAWASTDPSEICTGRAPGSCAPPDMDAFDDFATHVVQRYCGTIKYYETWNEFTDNTTWKGTNAELLTVAQHLYQIAKDPANCGCASGVCSPNGGTNPNQVLAPSISRITPSNLRWLDSYLGGAGGQYPYADVTSFHGYGVTNPEDIVAQVQSLNQVLANHGMSNLPLWNTEASWGQVTPVGQDQASWLMRYHVALAATGTSRFVWYAYDNCSWGVLWVGYCNNPQMTNESVTDGGQAYAVVESWLSGASLPNCQEYQNGLWACELKRNGGYDAWMLWSSTGVAILFRFPTTSA